MIHRGEVQTPFVSSNLSTGETLSTIQHSACTSPAAVPAGTIFCQDSLHSVSVTSPAADVLGPAAAGQASKPEEEKVWIAAIRQGRGNGLPLAPLRLEGWPPRRPPHSWRGAQLTKQFITPGAAGGAGTGRRGLSLIGQVGGDGLPFRS